MAAGARVQKLVGYVRVSSVAGRDKNEEAFKSPSVQREVMERWAISKYTTHGHKWIEWFEDLDSSGGTIARPKLQAASACAIKNEADLVVYNFSRYSRNLPEGLAALKTLEDQGVRVRSATEGGDGTSAEDELSLHLFMMINQYQLTKTGENWRSIVKRNKDEGRWHGIVPFGYRRATDEEKKKLGRTVGVIVPDAKNAKHVRRMFDLYDSGKPLYFIGSLGVANGWFKRTGTAKDILASPAYIGMLPVKEYVPAVNKKTNLRRRDANQRPLKEVKRRSQIEFVDGSHDAIVERDIWDKVQARLEKERRAPQTRYTVPRFAAAGRTRCGTCSRSLLYDEKPGAVKTQGRYLTCPNASCTGRPGSVKVEDLEQRLAAFMHELPIRIKPQLDAALRERNQALAESGDRRTQLDREIKKLNDQRASLALSLQTHDFEKGVTASDAEAALAMVRDDLEKREAERLTIDETATEAPQLEELRSVIMDVGRLWDLADNQRRVEILEALGFEVFISVSRKWSDDLEGRVTVRTSFNLGDLNVGSPGEETGRKAKSGPPKKPRLREGPLKVAER
jgi:site-specific DNA recombinase